MRRRTKTQVIADFKRKASQNLLLGNHFRELAAVGDVGLCPYLRKLRLAQGWNDQQEPWGQWVTVVCEWFENGPAGLARLAKGREGREYVGMCLAILAEFRTSENLTWMARILPLTFRLPSNPNEFEEVSSWCYTFVGLLNVGRPLTI